MSTAQRRLSVDLVRGIGLPLVAFQHLRYFLVLQLEKPEAYTTGRYVPPESMALFIMRLLDLVAVTGFFFFVGLNVIQFATRRLQEGKDHAEIFRDRALKGLVIILLDMSISPAFYRFFAENDEAGYYYFPTSLSTIGVILILMAFLVRWPKIFPWLGAALILGNQIYMEMHIVYYYVFHPSWWQALLFTGGNIKVIHSIPFPIVPWLGVACIGAWWGRLMLMAPEKFEVRLWKAAVFCFFGFFIVRIFGGFGNTYSSFPLRSPLDMVATILKQPPSLTFLFLTLAGNFVLLAFTESFIHRESFWTKPFMTFARNGLFFYVAHFYLYFALCGIIFTERTDSFPVRFITWLAGLVLLYGTCKLKEKYWNGRKV